MVLDLIRRDLVVARRLLWVILPLGGVQIAVMVFAPGLYVLGAFILCGLLAFGSIAIEEAQRTELLWNSLPLSRRRLVAARYASTLIAALGGLTFCWAMARAMSGLVAQARNGSPEILGPEVHGFLFGDLLLCAAIYLPLYFRLGAGRGLIWFSVIVGVVLVTVTLATPVISAEELIEWVRPRLGWLPYSFVGAAFLVMGGSLFVACKAYEGRDL
jgi:ABC-type transport system involved in multi-copper enzyme maturation permease subunit